MKPATSITACYIAGDAAITGQLEDYTLMVWGLIELYESTFEAHWLEAAMDLNKQVLNVIRSTYRPNAGVKG